ncbi:SURF4 family-domain-containing protein [Hysterangium stoloniferum]|nr:SURF4 family-domain-containing protein [Hysterangium stoloniferum]
MSSRINIARPSSASYNVDPHGMSNSRPSPAYRAAPSNPDDPIEKLRQYASKIEDYVDIYSQPLRPHLPAIGRFLIVVTFLEDALRIVTQWGDQLWYLQKHRHFPWGLSHLFLLLNVVVMLGGSTLTITRRHTEFAVAGLLSVVIIQGFGYGLIFDMNFFLRNLSVIGGLLMVFSDSMSTRKKGFAGLPMLSETDRKKYFQLTGRVLLIFLFLGFMIQGKWSFSRFLVSLVGLGACGMVAVGFKAKWSAAFLVIILSVFNVFVNNWWSVHSAHPQRDFLKYDFFQTLSIVGGLLLLVNMGPGGLSVDEKKKIF